MILMNTNDFQEAIKQGIPGTLPQIQAYNPDVNHAPVRKDILSGSEKKLAIRNALRYFDSQHHTVLAIEFAEELKKIGDLNEKYGIMGDYQNHTGTAGGSPVWDIHEMLELAQTDWIGVQYDIRHAMVEGFKSWPLGLRLLVSHIHSIDIKDFEYIKTDKGWDISNVPLGKGAVDFKSYFQLLNELNIHAPISLHLEYPLGGADQGSFELTIPKEKVIEAMANDLKYLRSVL